MNFLLNAAAALCPLFMAGAILLFFALEKARKRARVLEVQHATLVAQSEALTRNADDVEELREQNAAFLEQKSIAVTQLQESEKKLQFALAERNHFLQQRDDAFTAQAHAEKQFALMQQQMNDTDKRMHDWELQRAENLKATTASVMEVGNKLSSKILEDHKREAEAAKKEADEAARKNAESLVEQMLTVTKSVAALQAQGTQTQEKMSTVWRALTTPAGVGSLSEISLENSLKNFGLESGRDYVTQFHATGEDNSRLRPDAVIFLPQDMVMVIDSKASKFLMEIAEAEEKGAASDEQLAGLAATMNKHLNDLKDKDYESAVRTAYKNAGRASISATHMVMYVPSESAIAHLKRADAEFMQKAEKRGIIIASPASLMGLLSLARHNIGLVRQSQNHDLIIRNVQQLMDNVVSMLSHASKIGSGIKSAAEHFDKFSRSVNRNVLSKMQQLATLGVTPAKSKAIPARIGGFEVRSTDDAMLIEGEAEVMDDAAAIEDYSKQKMTA